ncbi:zona pellucida sperm-binding protein 3-like, partial [Clarias magur]
VTANELVYVFALGVASAPISGTPILRNAGVSVSIECHYPRFHNVSSNALLPAWIPFASSQAAEELLVFSLRLMMDDWVTESTSNQYYLGQLINIKASVMQFNHVALRVLIDGCVATAVPDLTAVPRYSFIENHGCLIDTKITHSGSRFMPQTQANELGFQLEAFTFQQSNSSLVYIACILKATVASAPADAEHKACSFSNNGWTAAYGPNQSVSQIGSPVGAPLGLQLQNPLASQQQQILQHLGKNLTWRYPTPPKIPTPPTYVNTPGQGDAVPTQGVTARCNETAVHVEVSPAPVSGTPILRNAGIGVFIECHYPRFHNVSSNALLPAWIPFASSQAAEELLVFSLRLMMDDWVTERISNQYYLGQLINIKASVMQFNHVALRVLIDGCVATAVPDLTAVPRYSFIENHGCLIDTKITHSGSRFMPQTQANELGFQLEAFTFQQSNSSLVYIACILKATVASAPADAEHKACSFSNNGWTAAYGPNQVCSCCDSSCAMRKGRDLSSEQ